MILAGSFSAIIPALGLSVVHSLWQIAFIWLIFKVLTWRLPHRNNAVYLLALAAMLASLVWSAATFADEYQRLAAEAEVTFFEKSLLPETKIEASEAEFLPAKLTEQSLFLTVQNWLEHNAAPVGWAWLLCASLLWLRLLGGWWLTQRLKKRGVSQPGEAFENLCSDLAKKLKIRQKIALLESSRVGEPLTIGFWKPVILFPVGMIAQLSTAQVEALLLHELAHIRRHDYLVNLFQLALEVCFFYHPMFWLLSREARTRREFYCDDMVLRHTSNSLLYAKTLTDLQLSFVHTQNHFAMNATGKSQFTERILRIVGITPKRSLRSNWLILLLLPLFVALFSWWPAASTPLKMPEAVSVNLVEPNRIFAKSTGHIETSTAQTDSVAPGYVVAAAPLKMNVFYVGVDNPLRVAASGIPANELSPRLVGAGYLKGNNGNYVVNVTEPGEATVQIYRKQGAKETLLGEEKYRVKRIPDPTPKLGGKFTSRSLDLKTLKEMPGIEAVLENFLFDATCEVMGYELTIVPAKKDPTMLSVQGSQFSQKALAMFDMLDSLGGTVFMDDIKVKCPGDAAPRNVGGLAFKVKAVE